MSDRRDNGPLRLPPDREVTPQLRSRVLHQAMREDRKPSRPPSRVGPILAGLAAAAVVVGVVYVVSQPGGDGDTPAAGGPNTQVVGPHDVVETVVKSIPDRQVADAQQQCAQAGGVDAKRRVAMNVVRSPLGPVDAVVVNDTNGQRTRVFCTPFGVVTSVPPANLVTATTPVLVVDGSRVEGLLPTRNERSGYQSYFDGAWFATTPSVVQIEVRLVVDGEAQTWHSAERRSGFIFASTWAPLDEAQRATTITVQYRAISVDGTLMPMPDGIESSSVTPAEARPLETRRHAFPDVQR